MHTPIHDTVGGTILVTDEGRILRVEKKGMQMILGKGKKRTGDGTLIGQVGSGYHDGPLTRSLDEKTKHYEAVKQVLKQKEGTKWGGWIRLTDSNRQCWRDPKGGEGKAYRHQKYLKKKRGIQKIYNWSVNARRNKEGEKKRLANSVRIIPTPKKTRG